MKTSHIVIITLQLLATFACGQAPLPVATPRPNSFLDRKAPTDALPGLVARTVLSRSGFPATPTHLVSVVSSGRDYIDRVQPLALGELRGAANIGNPGFRAFGYIILEADAEVAFDLVATSAENQR